MGSANLDTVVAVTALPTPGETVLGASPRSCPGGKGANAAVAAARAGATVEFVGAIGDDDAGAQLRRHLHDNGVGIEGLTTVPGPSGSAIITVDRIGQNTVVVVPAANAALTLNSDQRVLIAGAEVVLMQLEIPVSTATEAARLARAGGATVILNASPLPTDPAELADLIDLIDVAVVNATEADHFHHEVPHRVVTLGARGAEYRGPHRTLQVSAPPVHAIDTTGAGDVFAGVLATEWAGGIEGALRRACAAGALATLVPGAGNCAPSAEAITSAQGGITRRR